MGLFWVVLEFLLILFPIVALLFFIYFFFRIIIFRYVEGKSKSVQVKPSSDIPPNNYTQNITMPPEAGYFQVKKNQLFE
jgi:hypothetical protein